VCVCICIYIYIYICICICIYIYIHTYKNTRFFCFPFAAHVWHAFVFERALICMEAFWLFHTMHVDEYTCLHIQTGLFCMGQGLKLFGCFVPCM
jgi:hypothetical protein